jgi:hypothetical protein
LSECNDVSALAVRVPLDLFFLSYNLRADVYSAGRATRNIFAMETGKRLSWDNFLPRVDS